MFDEVTEVNILYDFYGELLTERQREAMKLYYEENLSLSEIAEEFSISRQAVHDALKNAEKSLKEYEKKLKFVNKFRETESAVRKIDDIINSLVNNQRFDSNMKERLLEVKDIIDKIND